MAVTQREIAAKAGVSVSTVSRILNGIGTRTVSRDTEKRVWEIARSLEYVKRYPTRGSTPAKRRIACILNSYYEKYDDPFFSRIIIGIEEALEPTDMSVDLSYDRDDLINPGRFGELMSDASIVGTIILSAPPDPVVKILGSSVPNIVCISEDYDEAGRVVDCVGYEFRSALCNLAALLTQQGRKRILYISGRRDLGMDLRLKQFRSCMELHGVHVPDSMVFRGIWDFNSGERIIEDIGRSLEYDAVFAENDKMALGVLKALHGKGIRVPDDIAVVGFDNIAVSEYSNPPLTTIDVPKE
jgi:LacI family transcriptional regulator